MGGGALKDTVVVCSVVVREREDVSLKKMLDIHGNMYVLLYSK